MAAKPETTFINSVNRHIPREVHREKMANPYRGGTADVWYSARKQDLWSEYKFVPTIPKTGVAANLSQLQLQWLTNRHTEGRNVTVIIGCPGGGVILRDRAWEHRLPKTEFEEQLLTRQEVARWITTFTLG